MKYAEERKEAILRKMLPPANQAVTRIAREEGISLATLYLWRKAMRRQGRLAPNEGQTAQTGSAQDKFAVVLETAALNAADLAAYCRARGLYPEQIQAWREACEHANDAECQSPRALKTEIQATRKRLRIVERDLARKDQALAEAAALLILRKKLQAVWGEDEDA